MSSTAVPTAADAVVDSSAILDLVTDGPAAAAVRSRLDSLSGVLYAPAIIDLEVLHVIRRWVLIGELALHKAEAAIEFYGRIEIMRFPHDPLIRRVWQLRENLTAYDAAYVALAEGLRLPFITLDARLAKACPRTIDVELIA